jgi:penicillin-binding protein 1C
MPTPGLHIARDPRIPDNAERLVFEVERLEPQDTLEWIVDGVVVGHSERGKRTYPWALIPGRHLVRARIVGSGGYRESQEVGFLVR